MKNIIVSRRGFMNVEIYYDAGIEIEVPDWVDYDNFEEFLEKEENKNLKHQFDNAFNDTIDNIHEKLTNAFGSDGYSEEGGQDELEIDELIECGEEPDYWEELNEVVEIGNKLSKEEEE